MGVIDLFSSGQKKPVIMYPYRELVDKVTVINNYVERRLCAAKHDVSSKPEILKLSYSIVKKDEISRFFGETVQNLDSLGREMVSELKRHNPMSFPIDKRHIVAKFDDLLSLCQTMEKNPAHYQVHTSELQHKAREYLRASEPYLALKTTRK